MKNICLFGDFFTDGPYGRLPYDFIKPVLDNFNIPLYVPYTITEELIKATSKLKNKLECIPWYPDYHDFGSYSHFVDDVKLTTRDFYHISFQYARLYRSPDSSSFSQELLSILGSSLMWREVLTQRKIDLVISLFPPHFVYDYSFYIACRDLGIHLELFANFFGSRT